MIRILCVEDEIAISSMIALSLKKYGYQCDCIANGAAVPERLEQEHYDLILLDIMLPGLSGFELMEQIQPLEIPVIFLTAKNEIADRVKGLKMGAEDYLVKPFAIAELLARIEVVLRRFDKGTEEIQIADLKIDPKAMQVWRKGELLDLTHREFDLLMLFVRNRNAALYRETIYEQVWGGDLKYGSKAVDLAVQRLRRKTGLEEQLVAVSGVGYRLEVEL